MSIKNINNQIIDPGLENMKTGAKDMYIKKKSQFYIMSGLLVLGIIIIIFVIIGNISTKLFAKISDQSDNTQTTSILSTESTNQGVKTIAQTNNSSDLSDILLLVNKSKSLDKSHVPSDLISVELRGVRDTQMRSEAAEALEKLFASADSQGITLYCYSGYRSYETQCEWYAENVNTYDQKKADLISAKPGQSEHQTGLTMDITSESVNLDLVEGFRETIEGQFIKNNAQKFGFIIRYPEDSTDKTGYAYEPWHLRYLGIVAATTIFNEKITLEEYLKK